MIQQAITEPRAGPAGLAGVEFALALSEARLARRIAAAAPGLGVAGCLAALGWAETPLDGALAGRALTRLHFGNEFCERLLPTPRALERLLARTAARGLALVLAIPAASDRGHAVLRRLFRRLPAGAEVVVNDWGTARLLRREFPALEAVAGRQLCKMIKDPRLPSPEWARLYPSGVHAAPFRRLLGRLAIRRIELDVPPFARPEDFHSPDLAVSVHAPFGYAVKGRMCRIGSLGLEARRKFGPQPACRKECLIYLDRLSRGPQIGAGDLHTFQRGTTLFYRHTAAMNEALVEAAGRGWIDRLVVAGDWHENRRPD